MTVAANLVYLLESRLPTEVETDGSEDDIRVIVPAMLGAITDQLKALILLEQHQSEVVSWQVFRCLFEYSATLVWLTLDPAPHGERFCRTDWHERDRLVTRLQDLGQDVEALRAALDDLARDSKAMPNMRQRLTDIKDGWRHHVVSLGLREADNDGLDSDALYATFYQGGSAYTHPSTHGVNRYVAGNPPSLTVGRAQPPRRDFLTLGASVAAIAAAAALESGTLPTIKLTNDDLRACLTA